MLVGLLLLLVVFRIAAQVNSVASNGKLTIRFANGKNGKPIPNDDPNIWFGNAKSPLNPRTNSLGEVTIETNAATPREIRVLPDRYADCRFKKDALAGMDVKYSVDEALSQGIVSDNQCGKIHDRPSPGLLVIYVRPFSFMEKLRM